MPKINKSKSSLMLFTLLIITVLIMALFMNDRDNLKNTNSPNKQIQYTPIINDVNDNISEQQNLQQGQIPPIDSEPPETKPDKPLFFSDDAFINHSIILGLYQDCIELLYFDKSRGIEAKYKYTSKVINKRISERFKYCQKVNYEHPDFYLDDSEKLYKNKMGSNSLLEKVLSHNLSKGEEDYDDSQFIKELSQTDPRVLLSTSTYYAMSSFHLKNSIAIVMKLTHSQQISHAYSLLDIGQNVYNCNLNGGCNKNSPMMYHLCIKNEDFCHLENYNEYIKLIMTKGQQADLTIVVSYIETLFENQ